MVLWDLAGGGAERSVLELASALQAAGADVRLAVFENWGDFAPDASLRLRELPAGRNKLGILALRGQLLGLIRDWEPDVLHAHLYRTNRALMRALLLIPRRQRPTVILTERNNLLANLRCWHGAAVTRAIVREIGFLYRRADAVSAISEGMRTQFETATGVPVRCIRNPLNSRKIRRRAAEGLPPGLVPEGHPLVVAAGRFVAQKGWPDLLRAFARVRRKEDARLLLLGQGPLQGELESLADNLGIRDAVSFVGFRANPYPLIRAADCFAVASHWEGYCTVLAEAMALGVPVVSTDCDFGPREYVRDGFNGLLVPPGQPDVLADAILRLLRDKGLARTLAANAPATAEVLLPARIAGEHLALYREVLARREAQ